MYEGGHPEILGTTNANKFYFQTLRKDPSPSINRLLLVYTNQVVVLLAESPVSKVKG